jgi:hypothetical protein
MWWLTFKHNLKCEQKICDQDLNVYRAVVDPGGHTRRAPPPPLILETIRFVGVKSWIFTRNTPKIVLRLPPLGAIFLSAPHRTWNPGSSPAENMWWLMFKCEQQICDQHLNVNREKVMNVILWLFKCS